MTPKVPDLMAALERALERYRATTPKPNPVPARLEDLFLLIGTRVRFRRPLALTPIGEPWEGEGTWDGLGDDWVGDLVGCVRLDSGEIVTISLDGRHGTVRVVE